MIESSLINLQDSILYFLKQSPRKTTDIVDHILKRYPASYQTVYNNLQTLKKAQILIYHQHIYQLNANWLEKTGRFTTEALQALGKNIPTSINSKQKIILSFPTVAESNRFVTHTMLTLSLSTSDMKYMYNPHQIYIYKTPDEEHKLIKMIKNAYVVIGNQTTFDMGVKKLIQKPGIRVSWVSKAWSSKNPEYYVIIGDYILLTKHDPAVEKKIEAFYRKTHICNQETIQELSTIMNIKGKHKLTIECNPNKAVKLKKKILREF